MTDNIDITSPHIKTAIDKASNVLLHCHPYADPDSVCSTLAMREVLIQLGKSVTIIQGDTEISSNLLGIKNVDVIKPQSWQEVDKTKFNLFIALDSSALTQISQKTEVVIPNELTTIVIDHHKTNTLYGHINLVESTYASTSQILYDLFVIWDVSITKDIALYLFIGLFSDTGSFRYLNTTAEVFQTASELVKVNPEYHKTIFNIENSKSAIEIEMMGLAITSIEKLHSGNIVFSAIPYSEIQKRNLTKEQAMEGLIAGTLRSVKGWEVVASLVEAAPKVVTVSLRTRDELKYDVSKIATQVGINGGGHRGAAGTTVNGDIYTAKKALLDAIVLNFPELS